MKQRFLASVAQVAMFDTNDNLIGISKTQTDNTLSISTQSTDIRSGFGNALNLQYRHTSELSGSLTDAQFNFDFIAANTGSSIAHTVDRYTDASNVELSNSAGNAEGVIEDTAEGLYAWFEVDGVPYVAQLGETVAGQTPFQVVGHGVALDGKSVCLKYVKHLTGEGIKTIEISSNIIPHVVKLVMTAQLFSNSSNSQNASTRIGTVQIVIPKAQLEGTQEISLTSTGVANTAINFMALAASEDNGDCDDVGTYAFISEILDNVLWYEGLTALYFEGGSIEIPANGDVSVVVKAVPRDQRVYTADPNNLEFTITGAGLEMNTPGVLTATAYAGGGEIKVEVSDGDDGVVAGTPSDIANVDLIS